MTPLVDPVGRKLAKAREARGLTLEEAALETRIRASQLAALEADDYAVFASNTYARGFLLIYGKFLGVDVREVARALEGGNPISIEEYQYLNAFPETEPTRDAPRRRETAREESRVRRPSIIPLVVFVLLLGAGALGVHLYVQAQRLESSDAQNSTSKIESVEPHATSTGTPAPAVAPAPSATTLLTPKSTPQPFSMGAAGNNDRAFLTNNPTAPNTAVPPAAAPQVQPGASPVPLPPVNELVVEPLKKAHVVIRRDDPNAEPIFDDILYPKVGPLKLKGARFFIQIAEPDAVALRKNGQSVAYQPGNIIVP